MRTIFVGLIGMLTLSASSAFAADAATLEANKRTVLEFYEAGLNPEGFRRRREIFRAALCPAQSNGAGWARGLQDIPEFPA
jgi:hypothetical protein